NLATECDDGSDEDNCSVIMRHPGYRSYLPPLDPKGSTLKLTPTVILTRVASINEKDMTVSLEFIVILKWRDDRFSLKHLTQKKTFLSKEDRSIIWTPDYQMSDLEGGHIHLVETEIYINTSYSVTQPNVNDLSMDKIYPGSSNDIVLQEKYTGKFTCLLELHAYPFD
ncbi:unnamed protein product, partial [Meganyctiphanes norvegica]